MSTRLRWLALPAAALMLTVPLAGCSDDDKDDSGYGSDSTDTSADTTGDTSADTSGTTVAGTPEGGAVEVGIGDSDLGEILIDPDGLTLYILTDDADGVPTCVEDCADAWPPLLADEVTGADGVTAELATVERPDGDMQVTVAGQPVYRFAADVAAGDVGGQAVGDKWFVVAPDGTPNEDAPAG